VIRTFEIDASGDATLVGEAESMADASAGLPAGSYTTLRTYGGDRLLRLDKHRRRLEDSLSPTMPIEPARLACGLRAVLSESTAWLARTPLSALQNGEREGITPDWKLRVTFVPPRLFASVERFEPLPTTGYRDGVSALTLSLHRDNPHAKATAFIAAAAKAYRALPPGVEEGLMIADDGSILEGLSSNFFAVLDGALRTEDDRVLPGVTRSLILELAAASGVPVALRALNLRDLDRTRESFITSVSREILPVVRIDGRTLGDGRPGPITRRLTDALHSLIAREAEPAESGMD
jgi:branched-subunit amino acid aminotransferase/4-amino-4-deoxychorismate lyase